MIYLITGVPGAGKTLFTLNLLYGNGDKVPDRPVYIDGIETDLEHKEIAGQLWPTVEDGSIVVIDECQRVFPTRKVGSDVPDYVRQLETHRHRGIDIYLVTQDSMLIDSHVRRLVGQYWRIERPGGLRYAKAKRWDGVPTNQNRLPVVQNRKWPFPKKLFDRYKSTTKDTHKFSLPKGKTFLYVFLLVVFLSVVGFALVKLFSGGLLGSADPDGQVKTENSGGVPSGTKLDDGSIVSGARSPISSAASGRSSSPRPDIDSLGIRELFKPRVEGRPWTAPIYRDELLSDPVPPLPAACVYISESRSCRCYTSQAVRLNVSKSDCMKWAYNGFHDFTGTLSRGQDRNQAREKGDS